MINYETASHVMTSNKKIYKTKDYSIFKTLLGNREIS